MDSDPSSLVTIVLDSHAFAHQVEAIEHFVPQCLDRLVGLAEHLIHQYHVVDPAFGTDDAVQEALLKLWKAVKARKIYTAELDEVLEKLVSHKLNQKVLDERAHEDRRKRGGPASVMSMRMSKRLSRTPRPPTSRSSPRTRSSGCWGRWVFRTLPFAWWPSGRRTGLRIPKSPPSSAGLCPSSSTRSV